MTLIDGKRTLLAYLDEAGDVYFGDSGTRYFLYTALVLSGEGFPLHRALLECRYSVIASQGRFSNSHEGNDYFHATEDSLETRAKVFPVLKEHETDARVYSIVVEKASLPDGEQTQAGLFQHAATALLGHLAAAEDVAGSFEHVCVMLDRIPVQKKRRAIIGALKSTLASTLRGTGVTFTVMPMASKSDLALQAVDYYSWALYRKRESGDGSQLARLGGNIVVVGTDVGARPMREEAAG